MKKLILKTVILALTLTLVSCDNPSEQNVDSGNTDTTSKIESVSTEDSTDTTETTSIPDEIPGCTVLNLEGGITVTVGGTDEILAQLGEPVSYMEAPSCVHEGYDKVYTFEGFCITTSPNADKTQYIAELSLISDTAAFEGGLTIGSDVSEVEDIFGTEFTEEFGVRKYILPGATASVIVDGDIVGGITVSAVK